MSMVDEERKMSKVALFLTKYPSVDGYTLICVCEEINRRTQASVGVDGIITQALRYDHAGEYLVRLCESFQKQEAANG
jgi:hypothetical protein